MLLRMLGILLMCAMQAVLAQEDAECQLPLVIDCPPPSYCQNATSI